MPISITDRNATSATLRALGDGRSLAQFLAVAECRSFTAASARLHLTQPALTKSVRQLERALGVTLFERMPRGVELTPIGMALLDHVRLLRTELASAAATLDALRSGLQGQVRVGAGHTAATGLLPAAIGALHARAPDIRIDLRYGTTEPLIAALRVGELDLLVAALPESLPNDVLAEPLTTSGFTVMARRGHRLARLVRADIEVLRGATWALPGPGDTGREQLIALLRRHGLPPPIVAAQSNSVPFYTALVRVSDHLGIAPRDRLRVPEAAGLKALDIPAATWERTMGLVVRQRTSQTPAAQALAASLRAVARRYTLAPDS
ncbi:MAG: LysR family transcriptional regulator [Tagaea sp.]|nr:LysR family transcriptional regulator [Tagaea sp.]